MTWLGLFGLVAIVVKVVVIVLERVTEPEIMRTRINRGSDEFFAWEKEHAGETELDEVLNPSELKG
jgi:hypothetical protein